MHSHAALARSLSLTRRRHCCLSDVARSDFDEDANGLEMVGEGEEGEEGQDGMEDGGADEDVVEIDRPMEGEEGTAVAMEDRITTPYMTKYERARILGTRALQIR